MDEPNRLMRSLLATMMKPQPRQKSRLLQQLTSLYAESGNYENDTAPSPAAPPSVASFVVFGIVAACAVALAVAAAIWTRKKIKTWISKRRTKNENVSSSKQQQLQNAETTPTNVDSNIESPSKVLSLDPTSDALALPKMPGAILVRQNSTTVNKNEPRYVELYAAAAASDSPHNSGRNSPRFQGNSGASSATSSPKVAATSVPVTVDLSITTGDVSFSGWVENPYCRWQVGGGDGGGGFGGQQRASSSSGTHSANSSRGGMKSGDSLCVPVFSSTLPDSIHTTASSSSGTDSPTSSSSYTKTNNKNNKSNASTPEQLHSNNTTGKLSFSSSPSVWTTAVADNDDDGSHDGSPADFTLSTHVEQPPQTPAVDIASNIDGAGSSTKSSSSGTAVVQRKSTSSGSGSRLGRLLTARTVKPQELLRRSDSPEEQQHQAQNTASITTALQPLQEQQQQQVIGSGGVPILSPTQLLQEIQLLRLLGAGGAGSVYEALWCNQLVAVKLLHPSRQTSPHAILAFKKELELMGRTRHPHIIRCLAACLDPPHMCIVQELAERGSLYAALHDQGLRPQLGALLEIAEDVASAMAHCHSLSPPLVHRDIKSHNVLLGNDGRARVADFGLAADKRRTFITAEASVLGTCSSMAPEQFQGGQVDEKCDVFAFGTLLWECLTGRQPWEDFNNPMQIILAVACEKKRLPIPDGCPKGLASLIKECWRHKAVDRPSFDQVLQRVREMRVSEAALHQPTVFHNNNRRHLSRLGRGIGRKTDALLRGAIENSARQRGVAAGV